MRAIICRSYGSPDVLSLVDRPMPKLKEREVLVEIGSFTVNSGDCRIRRADPSLVRLVFGWRAPRRDILGINFAGKVKALGSQAKGFELGQRIFGSTGLRFGANAEYCSISDKAIAIAIPDAMSYAEAASLPFGGMTAYHFLKKCGLRSGDKILIYGAAGSVGIAAVQLALAIGAEVSAVCRSHHHPLLRELGVAHLYDYQQASWRELAYPFPFLMDTVGAMEPKDWITRSCPGAQLILINATLKQIWQSAWIKRKVSYGPCQETKEALSHMIELWRQGKYRPIIAEEYPFEQTIEAHRYAEAKGKSGNVVVNVGQP